MPRHRSAAIATLVAVACFSLPGIADIPLAPPSAKGQTVTPVFEGWYRNPDVTYLEQDDYDTLVAERAATK